MIQLKKHKPDLILNKKKYFSLETLRKINKFNTMEILNRNKGITEKDIDFVGVLENGKLQLKVPRKIKDRQIIILLGYLKFFFK